MHRRRFIAGIATLPLAGVLPGILPATGLLDLRAERRYRYVGRAEDGFGRLQVEVHLSWTERAARNLLAREAHDPFDGVRGEFYTSGSSRVDIPDDVPGIITTYRTVVGVAAVKGVVHVGGFRRGKFVWIVRVSGGPVEYALDVAETVMAYDLPTEADVRLGPVVLESLLPDPADFSVPVEVEE